MPLQIPEGHANIPLIQPMKKFPAGHVEKLAGK
jgi:hypothetical protein